MRHGIKLSDGFVKPEQPCILYHFQGSIYTVEWQPKERKWTAIHVETP